MIDTLLHFREKLSLFFGKVLYVILIGLIALPFIALVVFLIWLDHVRFNF